MASGDAQLAVLLRKAEWMLDDAAYEVGGGRFSTADREALAAALDELAGALRECRAETVLRECRAGTVVREWRAETHSLRDDGG